MDEIAKVCPKCECPKWHETGCRTADCHSAWKDADGTWYDGPALDDRTRSCAHCGWAQRIERRHGKLESVESDAL